MQRKIRTAVSTLLLALVMVLTMTVPLIGCGSGISSDANDDIVTIKTGKQLVNDTIEMTNYQVVFKQTPEEWNALSDADKERLALAGYNRACEQIIANEISNFHVLGMSSPGEDAEGNSTDSQQAFYLNLEESALLIKTGTETTATVAVELPLG
jgi:hypothetical protein